MRMSEKNKETHHSSVSDDVKDFYENQRPPKRLLLSNNMVIERTFHMYHKTQKMSETVYCKFVGKVIQGADTFLGGRRLTEKPLIIRNDMTKMRFLGFFGTSWQFSEPIEG